MELFISFLRSSARFLVFPWGLIQIIYFNLFLYFIENKWMNEIKKSDLIKARKLSNNFRFIDDSNAINDGGEFKFKYCNICPMELELKKHE